MRERSSKAVELPQVRRMLNDLHKLEHELRTALCSCKKELHKQSARCPLLRDPTPSRRTWRGGLYVRTIHGDSTACHLLCALRGQSVRFSLQRDGAPALGTSARRQSSHLPVPAFSCLGRVHPQAHRGTHYYPGEVLDLGRSPVEQRVQAGSGLRCRGG